MSDPQVSDPRVVVALHAHPDDESLLTGGTLAALAAAGHRVVLVVATDGGLGRAESASTGQDLCSRRQRELAAAADELGVARVVRLGYADSGDVADPATGFAALAPGPIAEKVAKILRAEGADVLIGYDRNGGYGHPDHRQVHRVAVTAARLANVPRLLHATIDRTWIECALKLGRWSKRWPDLPASAMTHRWYADRREITHRVSVRRSPAALAAKRRALACHASQTTGGDSLRTVGLLLRLPRWLFAVVAGTEWFIEDGAAPPRRAITDLLEVAPASAPAPTSPAAFSATAFSATAFSATAFS